MRQLPLIRGADDTRTLDALFVNAPLRDYTLRPRTNDYTLPVLGMAYIATYAQHSGFNVGVLDAEAHGLGIDETAKIVNAAAPRWAAMNLLAPTYEMSARIAAQLDPAIALMVGGHHAKAMPDRVLSDPRMANLRALVLGEGELRVAALLEDERRRSELPGVLWRDPLLGTRAAGIAEPETSAQMLGPDVNALPYVNRAFLPQDPYRAAPTATDRRLAACRPTDLITAAARTGHMEANIVGSRGCPYNCTFCGAAASANPDVTIRVREPENIIGELDQLHDEYGVTAFRFVDDLFLGVGRVISEQMQAFTRHRIGDRYVWDATGRINVLNHLSDRALERLVANGLREVALGIESGSDRILKAMDKRIDAEMTERVACRLVAHGIDVKGYFILGFPGETQEDLDATVRHIRNLWDIADQHAGDVRASVFEFRPYPGTPVWKTLTEAGYSPDGLLAYGDVDLTSDGADESMRQRDEFNFSVGIQFGDVPLQRIRATLATLTREQHKRNQGGRGGRRVTVERTGWFVTVDGPSGVGKSTTVQALHDHLASQGRPTVRTVEPTTSALGQFTRGHANQIHGLALACLVAANRYEHIETEIEPALRAGELIVGDRYLPSTLVLQQLDGVPVDFLLDINRHVLMPDLAVILTADPGLIAERIATRGVTHRFHRDPRVPSREVDLYADVAAYLMRRGIEVLVLDTSNATPPDVARRIADTIPTLPLTSVASPAHTNPQET